MSTSAEPFTLSPAEMTRANWNAALGCLVTLNVEDSLDVFSTYTGRLVTIREGVGEVVLEDVTRTRHSGEVHKIARRAVVLAKVRWVCWLGF